MFKVMQQYGTAAQPATVYYCDDEADLQNINSAPMGAQALVIHTGNIYIAVLPESSTRCKDGGV